MRSLFAIASACKACFRQVSHQSLYFLPDVILCKVYDHCCRDAENNIDTSQVQLEALVSKYGVQPSSIEAALPIWMAMLAQSGVLNEAQQE